MPDVISFVSDFGAKRIHVDAVHDAVYDTHRCTREEAVKEQARRMLEIVHEKKDDCRPEGAQYYENGEYEKAVEFVRYFAGGKLYSTFGVSLDLYHESYGIVRDVVVVDIAKN